MAFQKLRRMLATWFPADGPAGKPARLPLAWIFLVAFALLKLWMIADLEITAYVGRVDDTLYAQLADQWFWGMPYSEISLVRLPVYPLWMALVHETGVPLRIAIEILQILAAMMICRAMWRAGFHQIVCGLLYLVLVFNPYSFAVNGRTLPDTLYEALLLTTAACMVAMLATPPSQLRWRAGLLTGLNLALLWNCRDENFLAAGYYLFLLGLYFLLHLNSPGNRWPLCRRVAAKLVLPLLMALVADYGIRSANYLVYGVFCRTENSSAYSEAYRAIFRVKPEQTIQYFSVPKATREKIYKVSPTLKSISDQIEGGPAGSWGRSYGRRYGRPSDIPSGQLVWVLRWAAGYAGKHQNAREAQQFYRQIAREINTAIDQGKLKSRPLLPSFLDPATFQYLDKLPISLQRVFQNLLYDRADEPLRDNLPLTYYTGKEEHKPLIDRIASRRLALTLSPREIAISGSILAPGAVLTAVELLDDSQMLISRSRMVKTADPAQKFAFKASIGGTIPFNTGYLRFLTTDNLQILLPVVQSRTWSRSKLAGGWELNLDEVKIDRQPVPTANMAARERILKLYRWGDVPIFCLAGLGLILALVFWKWRPFTGIQTAILLLFACIGFGRMSFWTLVDLTMFYCYSPRYSFPAQQIFWCMILPLAAVPVHLFFQWLAQRQARQSESTKP